MMQTFSIFLIFLVDLLAREDKIELLSKNVDEKRSEAELLKRQASTAKVGNEESNLHYTRGITPKRVTSGEIHPCG